MPRRSAIAVAVVALGGLAACGPPYPNAAPLASLEVAADPGWPVAEAGCEIQGAPPRPEVYDERAVATLMTWVYRDAPVEDYCGCAFRADQAVGPDCPYAGDGEAPAAIVWEPVVPPSRFGVYRRCWKQWSLEGQHDLARRKCAEVDEEFRAMEADLYNYHPALAALSQKRGENPFAPVQGEPRDYGGCEFETQSDMGKALKVEPPENVKGDLARIYLYMAARYGKGKDWKIKLSREQRLLLEKWSEADPVDDREKRRACRIQAIQGWENPYVK
jgi:deoxyribonuclease-1